MILLRTVICAITILFLYACFGSMSMEFNSARSYVRIEDNLQEGEKWGLKALEIEPDNAQVPYFLAVEVYRPMKKEKKASQMFIEALNRTEGLVLDRPFKVGEEYVNNVHEAIKLEGQKEYNEGVELFGKNKKTKAIAKFELSTKLVPGFVQPYISLSTIAMADEKYDKALDYINEGFKLMAILKVSSAFFFFPLL